MKAPWWQTGVVYQVYPRSFQDTTGNGVGDLEGIRRRLDYLADTLGVDVVWLSPFYPSPQRDHGYDISDYCDVDPLFGDLADFDRLLADAHARGLRLIVDLVPNHTSDLHPWFQQSRSSRDDPRRDWYVWSDPAPGGGPPNNWLGVFGGSAWEWDEATGQYYLHSFLREQPDLNWRNPEVEAAFHDVMRFWLDRGVDGFRIDTAHYMMKDPALRDNPATPPSWVSNFKPLGAYDSQVHLHDKGHEDIHPLHRRLRAVLDEYDDRFAVGEIHIFEWEAWARYYGSLDQLHMPFNFSMLYADFDAPTVRGLVEALEQSIPLGAWPNYVLGNHDEMRLLSRFGTAQARLAAMLLLTLRGTPTLYYGDELGMADVELPPDLAQDPWANEPGVHGRDGCRTPMRWGPGPTGGFSPSESDPPWLPMGDDVDTVNVTTQLTDPSSMLNLYRRLLAVRRSTPPLLRGEYHPLPDMPDTCFAFRRTTPGSAEVVVALNFGKAPVSIELGAARVLVGTHPDAADRVAGSLRLRPHEGLVMEVAP